MFRFASPYYLLLLAIIPVAIAYAAKRRLHPVLGMSSLSGVTGIPQSPLLQLRWVVSFLKYSAFVLMIISMARPQMGTKQISIQTKGINIVLAVDISESMAALDFKKDGKTINRLEATKSVVQDFITGREGDRIGMVVFGSNAYTQIPLTRDYNTISSMLEKIEIGAAGKSTAIGDAIGISLKRLQDIESKSNIIILLTDGRSNSGEFSPEDATKLAVKMRVKVYTIGVGGKGRAPFLIKHPLFGEQYVYQNVDIDEDTLKHIADETGGLYFRAQDMKGLQDVYKTIDRLEKTEVKVKTFAEYKEYYPFLLVPALILLIGWALLSNTRFLKVP